MCVRPQDKSEQDVCCVQHWVNEGAKEQLYNLLQTKSQKDNLKTMQNRKLFIALERGWERIPN